jgi:hypothetical protein
VGYECVHWINLAHDHIEKWVFANIERSIFYNWETKLSDISE